MSTSRKLDLSNWQNEEVIPDLEDILFICLPTYFSRRELAGRTHHFAERCIACSRYGENATLVANHAIGEVYSLIGERSFIRKIARAHIASQLLNALPTDWENIPGLKDHRVIRQAIELQG